MQLRAPERPEHGSAAGGEAGVLGQSAPTGHLIAQSPVMPEALVAAGHFLGVTACDESELAVPLELAQAASRSLFVDLRHEALLGGAKVIAHTGAGGLRT